MSSEALAVFDAGEGRALFVGGLFGEVEEPDSVGLARWNGRSLELVEDAPNRCVEALAVFGEGAGSALYLAGDFTAAGGVPFSGVARWDGTAWHAVDAGLNGGVHATGLLESPVGRAPSVFAGGSFTRSGDHIESAFVGEYVGEQVEAGIQGRSD